MRIPRPRIARAAWLAAALAATTAARAQVGGPRPPASPDPTPPGANPGGGTAPIVPYDLMAGEVKPIDLCSALRLAGVQNPELNTARQLVLEAVALRQFAAAQILPTISAGASYDKHTGTLQQSTGNILSVNRSSAYVGGGSFPVGAGPVAVPGVVLQGNISEGIYGYLVTKQVVRQREYAATAARNDVLQDVCLAYCELIRAEGRRAILAGTVADADELVRVTGQYARTGQGRLADADRAASDRARRRAELRRAEADILIASARLCRLLNLDPSIRLHPTDAYAVPLSIVPDPIPLPELIALSLLQRPELAERRAAIRAALLALDGAKVLPFSPTTYIAYSAGGFGGGSNLVVPQFGGFSGRIDFDVYAYWSLRNLGVGNAALVNTAKANLGVSKFQELATLDRVRDEVASAYASTHARFAQIEEDEQAVRSSMEGFRLDLERIKQGVPGEGLNPRPIEVLNSLDLLYRSRREYLDAIVDYNQAHFRLYVALGQPPAAALARPVPAPSAPIAEETSPLPSPSPSPSPSPPPAGGSPFDRPAAAAGGR